MTVEGTKLGTGNTDPGEGPAAAGPESGPESGPGEGLGDATRRALAVPADILALDAGEMRRLGYWVVDRVVDHFASGGDGPALVTGDPSALRQALGGPVPRAGSPVGEGLARLADIAVAAQQHGDHPRYFARVPGPMSFPAVLGDWLVTGTQSVASSWGGGSGPSTVELIACEWLRDALGLDPGAEGVLLSGGSMANLTGLIAARITTGPGVVYLSDQAHASLRRGLLAAGQPPEELRILPADESFRLDPGTVAGAIEADRAAGRRPAIIIATAGTTNTGAVDDLAALADLASSQGMWLHVDGAYGGPAALTERGRAIIGPALARADSFVADPHKWLFQPYGVACLLVRHPGALERAFAMHPEYLADVGGPEVTLSNRGLELTRRARAFKLWLTFFSYGFEKLALAIERGMGLAEFAQHEIEAEPGLEVVTPAQLGIVTFAGIGRPDAAQVAAAAAMTESGYAALSSTVLRGRTVLRLCTINPRTTQADISGTVSYLGALLRDVRA